MFVEPYLATVTVFAGNYAPRGWMFCQGQLLAVAEYNALFALVGTTYGGDGQTTFALPDLRSRSAISMGQGAGLSPYSLGEVGGIENRTLLSSNLPAHNHSLLSFTVRQPASTSSTSGVSSPKNAYSASGSMVYSTNSPDDIMGTFSSIGVTTIAGASMPMNIISPYIAMNYIIAVEGIFPSRN